MVEQEKERQLSLEEIDLLTAFLERADLPWPKDAHENGLELFKFYPDPQNPLFGILAKPIRITEPGRDLWSKTPESPEVRSLLEPKHEYGEEVYPNGVSGQHKHYEKKELFYAKGPLWLYLYNPETGDRKRIEVYKRTSNTVFGFYIPPGVVHAFQNVSNSQSVDYDIISNMTEPEAIAADDKIIVPLNFNEFQ